jgi:biotin transport system substrate-specific component
MGVTAEAKLDRKFLTMLPCALLANATILACGLFWLAFVAHIGTSSHGIGMGEAWSKGVAPFIFANILKAMLAAAILPASWALLGARPAP